MSIVAEQAENGLLLIEKGCQMREKLAHHSLLHALIDVSPNHC